jgi:hypothetical protein
MGRHRFDTFVDNPPSVAQGGRGVVVPGCSVCRVRLQTVEQYIDHLTESVMCAIREGERKPQEPSEAVPCSEIAKLRRE